MVKVRKNKNSKRKILLIIIIVVVVLAAGIGALVWKDPFGFWGPKDSEDSINYDPPTEEEKKAVDEFKDTIDTDPSGEETDQPTEPGTKKQVKPFISVAQQFHDMQYGNRVEVRSYVDGVIESGGSCNIVFTQGSRIVSWPVEALPDASTTICDTAMVPRDKFPQAGTWTVTVAYSSDASEGTSDPFNVEVK